MRNSAQSAVRRSQKTGITECRASGKPEFKFPVSDVFCGCNDFLTPSFRVFLRLCLHWAAHRPGGLCQGAHVRLCASLLIKLISKTTNSSGTPGLKQTGDSRFTKVTVACFLGGDQEGCVDLRLDHKSDSLSIKPNARSSVMALIVRPRKYGKGRKLKV